MRLTIPAARNRLTLIICALALAAPPPAPAQQPAPKRALRHADYDGWRSIQAQQLSRDGKFLAYVLAPQDGDGEIVARNLATGAEWRHGRGSRPEPAAPAEGAAPPAPPRRAPRRPDPPSSPSPPTAGHSSS